MKKLNVWFITLLLTVAFTGISDCLFAEVADLLGHGNAQWGHTKAKTRSRYAKRQRSGQVNITERENFIIINYRTGRIVKKRLEFRNDRLYEMTLTYSYTGQRIVNNYNKKYKPFTKIENDTYIWKFPSTVITYKKGTNYTVFTNSAFAMSLRPSSNNMDDIRIGMTSDQIRELMGTPDTTATAAGDISIYRYPTGVVTFKNLRVTKIEKADVQLHRDIAPVQAQSSIGQVEIGMNPAKVEQIMGQPISVNALGNLTVYRYKTGTISFKYQRVAEIVKGDPNKETKIIKKKK